jgi:hypothetical protein
MFLSNILIAVVERMFHSGAPASLAHSFREAATAARACARPGGGRSKGAGRRVVGLDRGARLRGIGRPAGSGGRSGGGGGGGGRGRCGRAGGAGLSKQARTARAARGLLRGDLGGPPEAVPSVAGLSDLCSWVRGVRPCLLRPESHNPFSPARCAAGAPAYPSPPPSPTPLEYPAETCPISTEGWTRRVHFVREGGEGRGGGGLLRGHPHATRGPETRYSLRLAARVQRPGAFPGETAADRMVPAQPRALRGALERGGPPLLVNARRTGALVFHLLQARALPAARTVPSFVLLLMPPSPRRCSAGAC